MYPKCSSFLHISNELLHLRRFYRDEDAFDKVSLAVCFLKFITECIMGRPKPNRRCVIEEAKFEASSRRRDATSSHEAQLAQHVQLV